MNKIEDLINQQNASLAMRYLFNLDVNVIDEKYRKIGISNLVDFKKAKRLCLLAANSSEPLCNDYEQITKEVISLSMALNDEAKQNLFDYLTVSQHIS